MRFGFLAALLCSFAFYSATAEAGSRSRWSSAEHGVHPRHAKTGHYRGGGVKVKGFVQRRGGYSYGYKDTINTYGHGPGRFDYLDPFRDPFSDRQTVAGPFDSGFFFDSPARPHGGDAPYMH